LTVLRFKKKYIGIAFNFDISAQDDALSIICLISTNLFYLNIDKFFLIFNKKDLLFNKFIVIFNH